MKKSIKIEKNAALRNYYEIPQIFKALVPGDKYFGLAHITEVIIGKKLSKGDQCSNWNLRPLRKAQLHYGAMDSVVLLKIYEKFTEMAKIVSFSFIK